ncbi:Putative adhesin [Tenacibaculum sp. MAR_2010_89]|uniref:DUF4097 family beta strand repeat-containing protein n=1 Tax=Tenacibaculum sp. MAR_2010_89 TaxID=1250198 RepID=UPI0008996FC7|nr:DUF4097 family beta strand repeat-containing protein [Tenacibaculum sp. MAR_2010_89]SEE16411.1 Putative adhesin [Tenacibaculum sp. MAR_2010_89]
MKSLFLFIGLLLPFSNLTAQKKAVTKQNSNSIEEVYVNTKFANTIEVQNWNKNEISVVANVNINDNKDNDYFKFETKKTGAIYNVKSDFGNLFKKHKKGVTITHSGKGCNSYNFCSNHNNIVINYVIYVPKKMTLKVKSISGDVAVSSYQGKLTLDLVSGNIDIKKHSENMYLKTVSGDIDVAVADATFEARTLTGTVYSDLDIDFNQKSKRSSRNKIQGTIKNGTAYLKLKTVSGDILLRKI